MCKQKHMEICFKFTMDNSNFDKPCSDAHFAPFLFYYYCTNSTIFALPDCHNDQCMMNKIVQMKIVFYWGHKLYATKKRKNKTEKSYSPLGCAINDKF